MDVNLKNSFNNVLLSTGGIIEYLAGLKSKNVIVPNNRFDKNNSAKYNGLISTLSSDIDSYNAVLDEFVSELDTTERELRKVKLTWDQQDSIKPAPIPQPKIEEPLQQTQEQVPMKQEADLNLKMDLDDDAYLSQFLEGDVVGSGMESNGLLDFGNVQQFDNPPKVDQPPAISPSQQQNLGNVDSIDATKNPADILYQGANKTPAQQEKEITNDDINLDDLEELLASTNNPTDLNYDAGDMPVDDDNIFDELNYFLGGDEEG